MSLLPALQEALDRPPPTLDLSAARTGIRLSQLPVELGQLDRLEVLDLTGNGLVRLPPLIGRLTSLRVLRLCGNPLLALPPDIGELTLLEELDLTDVDLSALPDGITRMPKLRRLVLGGNPLVNLSADLKRLAKLPELQELSLLRLNIRQLPKEIAGLPALRHLDLAGNNLARLCPELTDTTLTSLGIAGNRMTTFPEIVCGMSTVERLDASSNAFREIPGDLQELTKLRELDLRDSFSVVFSLLNGRKTRDLTYAFLKLHFDEILRKSSAFERPLLFQILDVHCDAEHRADAEAFFGPRAKTVDGAARVLANSLESVALCEAGRKAALPSLEAFLKKY